MRDFLTTLGGLLLGVLFFVLIWGTGANDKGSLAGKSNGIFNSITTEMADKVKVSQ
ncbi:hypothetical protein LY28_03638 [Ruminiclostridium sufflavum DSM 19573]|uniref:Uncharacterized protein n=1 Tax=Ruminiclostridium sufflavum DSM 19573 TaxID=1121337 RepID=A0A318Y0W8_9FIRM|nr:hypothetical protein [Ruminiclostridium sufflavum]PYG84324.1 hypothetical protein LY28_03638 [Ruminiclostridium sufflavum DSM 19573]